MTSHGAPLDLLLAVDLGSLHLSPKGLKHSPTTKRIGAFWEHKNRWGRGKVCRERRWGIV